MQVCCRVLWVSHLPFSLLLLYSLLSHPPPSQPFFPPLPLRFSLSSFASALLRSSSFSLLFCALCSIPLLHFFLNLFSPSYFFSSAISCYVRDWVLDLTQEFFDSRSQPNHLTHSHTHIHSPSPSPSPYPSPYPHSHDIRNSNHDTHPHAHSQHHIHDSNHHHQQQQQ